MSTEFTVINRTLTLPIVLVTKDEREAICELLSIIDTILSVFIETNACANINFNYLQIIHSSKYTKAYTYECYTFCPVRLLLVSSTGRVLSVHDNDYLINSIATKITALQNKQPNQQPNQQPIQQQNIFDEPRKIQLKKKDVINDAKDLIEKHKSSNFEYKPSLLKQESFPTPMDAEITSIEENTLADTIKELQELKNKEQQKVDELETNVKKDAAVFSEFYNNFSNKKQSIRREIERENERKNRFDANKEAYYRMKKDIEDGKLNENKISYLFEKEYPIFKFLDQKELLDTDNDYSTFVQMYDGLYSDTEKLELDYIPHNIEYLPEDEQEKYKDKSKHKDLVEEFINKDPSHKTKRKYDFEPLDKLIPQLDKEISEENELGLELDTITF